MGCHPENYLLNRSKKDLENVKFSTYSRFLLFLTIYDHNICDRLKFLRKSYLELCYAVGSIVDKTNNKKKNLRPFCIVLTRGNDTNKATCHGPGVSLCLPYEDPGHP